MTKKLYIFILAILHSLHRGDEKNYFSPIANCYYVDYVVIMSKKYFHIATTFTKPKYTFLTKIYVFISPLRVLFLDHVKKYTFFHFSTTFSRS